MVAHGTPCLGPVTHAGCGAICPAYDRGCYGCFGPMEDPNTASLLGLDGGAHGARTTTPSCALYRTFNAAAEPFRTQSEAHERGPEHAHAHGRLPRPRGGRGRDVREHPRRRVSRTCGCEIYEPPRFFEAFLRGRAFQRGAGHHGADLRHLPRRLPDELDRGDGGRAAAWTSATAVATPAAAPLLRRVDREPHPARVPAPRARLPRLRRAPSRWRATTARSSSGRSSLKKAGNELMTRRSAAARSIRSTCASAASTVRRRRDELAPVARAARARRGRWRWRRCAGPRASISPTTSATTSSSRSRSPATTRSSAAGSSRAAGSTSRPPSSSSTSSRSTWSTRTPCTRGSRERGNYSSARWPATASTRTALSPLAREAAARSGPRAGVPQSVPEHRGPRASRSLYACDEAIRDHRRVRAAGSAGSRRAAAGRARPRLRPRRRAECSTTATHRRRRDDPEDAKIVPPTSQNQASDRGGPARRRRAAPRPAGRGARRCAASRRSATTTPASPAPRTS